MTSNSVSHKNRGDMSTRELRWPKVHWRVGVWFTAASTLLTVAVVIFPSLSGETFDWYRVLLVVLVMVGTFSLASLVPWVVGAMLVVTRRVRYYPRQLEELKFVERYLAEMRSAMADVLLNSSQGSPLEIAKAAYVEGRYYVVLRREVQHSLVKGDQVEVIDLRDTKTMGRFRVTEVRQEEYYAEGVSSVDPLWSGLVRERGETTVTPWMIAMHPQGGGQDGK